LENQNFFSRIVYKTNKEIIFEAYRRKIIQYLSISTKTLYRRKNLKKLSKTLLNKFLEDIFPIV